MEDLVASGSSYVVHSQKRPPETCSNGDEDDWMKQLESDLPPWTPGNNQPGISSGIVPNQTNVSTAQAFQPPNNSLLPWTPGNNQPGISSEIVPNQTNVSTAQAFQPPNNSNASLLKRSNSRLSESDREKKRKTDQAYRERCKKNKAAMQSNLEALAGENESLKKKNESLIKDNALMKQILRDQAKEMDRLKNDFLLLKGEHERQNVLVQTLTDLLADPMRLENEKLKDENASLRKNASHNNNLTLLVEENAKLKLENKVLKVQNDALCGKIISDNDKKCEQEEAKMLFEVICPQ